MKNLLALAAAAFLLSAGSAFAQPPTPPNCSDLGNGYVRDGVTSCAYLLAVNPDGSINVNTSGSATGALNYTFEVAANDNHQVIKNGAGTIKDFSAFSIHTVAMFVRLYNLGTGFNGCNSATGLIWEGNIPAAATGAGFIQASFGPAGRAFTTGLAICVTGAFGNTNTTAATASVASVNIGYN